MKAEILKHLDALKPENMHVDFEFITFTFNRNEWLQIARDRDKPQILTLNMPSDLFDIQTVQRVFKEHNVSAELTYVEDACTFEVTATEDQISEVIAQLFSQFYDVESLGDADVEYGS